MSQPDQTTRSSAGDTQVPALTGRSLWADARRRLMRDRGAMICLAVILLYALVAVGVAVYEQIAEGRDDWPTFKEMADYSTGRRNRPPTLEPLMFWRKDRTDTNWQDVLGTDWAGKSVLIKTIFGAKVSMSVGLISNLIGIPLGIILGAIAGYYGGRLDDLIVWLYSTLLSVPGIVLLIALKFAFKGVRFLGLDLTGIHGLYLALGVIGWTQTCRLIRAEVMKIRELEYCVAARATGRGSFPILMRHIVPNVLHIGIINFSLGFIGAVKSEVMLSYFGLGVGVGTASWGVMINSARMDLFAGRWWELTAAVSAMFVLVLALNIFGDRLRDALDPRLRNV
ncbi:MAG TPA: ABC transporter permease [Phycisphaerae bacterium]|nr:ABC transporter permease [Phycisphaerae bacterium]HUT60080.1 ABC transporter permease [Phycisphaerae bacterium]